MSWCFGWTRTAGISRSQIGSQGTQKCVSFSAQNGGLRVSVDDKYIFVNDISECLKIRRLLTRRAW